MFTLESLKISQGLGGGEAATLWLPEVPEPSPETKSET